MKVYLLQHSWEYDIYEDVTTDNSKLIGIYSSEEKAKDTIERYKTKQGFRRFPIDCFHVGEIELDQDRWTEGFVILDNKQKDNIPEGLEGEKPCEGESGKGAAKRVLEGRGEYDPRDTGPGTVFYNLKKRFDTLVEQASKEDC